MDSLKALLRGALAVVALFLLLNALGELLRPRFDTSVWLLDLRPFSAVLRTLLLLAGGAALLAAVLWKNPPPAPARAAAVALALLAALAFWQSVGFYRLAGGEGFRPRIPVPLTLPVGVALAALAWVLWSGRWGLGQWRPLPLAAGALLAVLLLPLSQIVFFGTSDYRRSADVIVVLGARAYADGRCSDALADRVRTAAELYREGRAGWVVMSGGPGDGAVHETEAMRDLAATLGVPAERILLDRHGLNTEATARNVTALAAERRFTRVLAVSHAYHQPRIKLAFQRSGLNVYTVPARETYWLSSMPRLILREIGALWVYYLRPLVRDPVEV